jgi:hypothetical protein
MRNSNSLVRWGSTVLAVVLAPGLVGMAAAGTADVVEGAAKRQADGSYVFVVTVRHADEGWEHFADRYEVVGPDGTVIASRVLAHPHEDEQPFTRELTGVRIPAGIGEVTIRAHDNRHGLGGREVKVRVGE